MDIKQINRTLTNFIIVAALTFAVVDYAHADSTTDIVGALVSKGVLTEEEGELITKGRNGEVAAQKKKEEKAWTNGVNIRGYVQNRNNLVTGASSSTLVPTDYGRFQADALRVQLQYNF